MNDCVCYLSVFVKKYFHDPTFGASKLRNEPPANVHLHARLGANEGSCRILIFDACSRLESDLIELLHGGVFGVDSLVGDSSLTS